jgi:hypothetical protein
MGVVGEAIVQFGTGYSGRTWKGMLLTRTLTWNSSVVMLLCKNIRR